MAKAEVTKTVVITVEDGSTDVVTEVTGVVLALDADEAQTLIDIISRVGGSPTDSRREHAQQIFDALSDGGLTFTNQGVPFFDIPDLAGTLTFE